MEVVVRGRNVEVPDHFRQHVADKLARVERYDGKIVRADVELHHERNRRQQGSCQHIEITCRTRGPMVRAEACASDFYSALDAAVERLERRFRHAADRRRVHHGRRTPTSLATASAAVSATESDRGVSATTTALLERQSNGEETSDASGVPGVPEASEASEDDLNLGQIVRVKHHPAVPMTPDDALHLMELVGHDFYLFSDAETGRPSVVYRRHAYQYGLITLAEQT
jgi:ribosomal subunit interface protein